MISGAKLYKNISLSLSQHFIKLQILYTDHTQSSIGCKQELATAHHTLPSSCHLIGFKFSLGNSKN
jgi:hypothetical protein